MAKSKSSLEKLVKSYINRRADLYKKRDRLQDAYDAMKRAKDDHSDLKNQLSKSKKADAQSDDWVGSNYDDYISYCMFAEQNTIKIYDRIDAILDGINDKLNDVNDDIYLIGVGIRNLQTEIENWQN